MTYQLTSTVNCDENGNRYTTYGIAGAGMCYNDLSLCREQIETLVRDCNELALEPCHLCDVVNDFIAGKAKKKNLP